MNVQRLDRKRWIAFPFRCGWSFQNVEWGIFFLFLQRLLRWLSELPIECLEIVEGLVYLFSLYVSPDLMVVSNSGKGDKFLEERGVFERFFKDLGPFSQKCGFVFFNGTLSLLLRNNSKINVRIFIHFNNN